MQVARAAFFARCLSRLYLDPPDAGLLEELARADLAAEWPFGRKAASGFAGIKTALSGQDFEALSQELRYEHMLLFVGIGMPLVPLWSSVYLDKENLLMGESSWKMEDFLARAGLGEQLGRREPLDNLGLTLSAIGVFLDRLDENASEREETEAQLREFLETHLSSWVPRCLELLAEKASSPFYRGLGDLTSALLEGLSSVCGAGQIKQPLYY
jgi:TorA maturation chaperone TorD